MLKIKTKIKLLPGGKKPIKATEFAGAYDVFARDIKYNSNRSQVTVHLGFALQPPPGFRVMLHARSSITKSPWFLHNSVGLVDCDFTGELLAKFLCMPSNFLVGDSMGGFYYQPFPCLEGGAIGQIYLERIMEFDFEDVKELEETQRGEGGFGSTDADKKENKVSDAFRIKKGSKLLKKIFHGKDFVENVEINVLSFVKSGDQWWIYTDCVDEILFCEGRFYDNDEIKKISEYSNEDVKYFLLPLK